MEHRMSRKVEVTVEVTVDDDDVSDVQISTLVEMMLKVGQADAAESAADPDLDDTEDAEIASEFTIGEVYIKE
jgi:hypothetical protein